MLQSFMGQSTAGPAFFASFLRVSASAFSQMSLGMAGMPLGCEVVGFSGGFRFSSWVFSISLLSPARMARPGCSDVYWAVFKCHENAIFKGGQKKLI